jgi:hypothetical protein
MNSNDKLERLAKEIEELLRNIQFELEAPDEMEIMETFTGHCLANQEGNK